MQELSHRSFFVSCIYYPLGLFFILFVTFCKIVLHFQPTITSTFTYCKESVENHRIMNRR